MLNGSKFGKKTKSFAKQVQICDFCANLGMKWQIWFQLPVRGFCCLTHLITACARQDCELHMITLNHALQVINLSGPCSTSGKAITHSLGVHQLIPPGCFDFGAADHGA